MTESQILSDIMLAIGAMPGVRIFRNNLGVARYADGASVRYGVGGPGGADLIGWCDGRFLAIEVKTPGGRVAPAQHRFLDAVTSSGGVAGICRSAGDALALIQAART